MSNACSQFFAGRDDFIIEALPARSQGGTFLLQCEVLSWNEQQHQFSKLTLLSSIVDITMQVFFESLSEILLKSLSSKN